MRTSSISPHRTRIQPRDDRAAQKIGPRPAARADKQRDDRRALHKAQIEQPPQRPTVRQRNDERRAAERRAIERCDLLLQSDPSRFAGGPRPH